MCFDNDARPPRPPLARIRGGATDHGDITLTSADGTEFLAAYAHPDRHSSTAVVIMPDVRGLHRFYKELAQRFAEAGHHAVAFDYFGRTAGIGDRGDDFEYRPHVDKVQPEHVADDTGAAIAWLRGLPGTAIEHVFTLGFCFGGAYSWRQSAEAGGLAGCMGFYGRPDRAADAVPRMRAPLLLLAAGQDHTPVSAVEEFAEQVRAAGVDAEMHVYPDAPHSFFDRRDDEHQEACEDAWHRILDFMARHSGTGSGGRS